MNQVLRNNKILIFGGSSGIGKACAKRFLDANATVTISGRNKEKLENVKDELKSDNLFYNVFDITKTEEHLSFFDDVSKQMGGLTAFVNTAAIGTSSLTGRGYEPWDITPEEWDILNDTNFKAAYFLMRNEIDYFKANKIKGNILNFASNAACMDIVGSYGAAKTAIIKWTRAFGKKFGHDRIIINGIAPGATFTPMISRYAKQIDQPYPRHAIERFIRPEEIAELAFYLMSNYGEIICGHTVIADGGDNCATL